MDKSQNSNNPTFFNFFPPGTWCICYLHLRHFIRGTVQEVTGQLVSELGRTSFYHVSRVGDKWHSNTCWQIHGGERAVSLAGAALRNRIITSRGPIPQSLPLVLASSLCNLSNVLGLCKKIKMRSRNNKKGLKRGKTYRRRQEYKHSHSGNSPDEITNKYL